MEELRKNPYFDPSIAGGAPIARPRQSKPLKLNAKGKHIAHANALRQQARLEDIKKQISDKQRRVALEESNNRVFAVPEPPVVEWWDESLIVDNDYTVKSDWDSVITIYVQHPVPIEPPMEKLKSEPKPMPLTKEEQAKIRRQTRKLEMKEEQAKIRLGLKAAPPPKANKSNMMRVYPDEAVRDPTALEMRVSREIAARADTHAADNASRKLTSDQRREKLASQQADDAAKGIHTCVFRVETLCFGRHRYQLDVNAKQNALTGMVVMGPSYCVVVVEGGAHSVRNFKKLVLNRIRWTENAAPASTSLNNNNNNRDADMPEWLQSVDPESGDVKDIGFNSCTLVWEGNELGRVFRKWMGGKVCMTDSEAKDALARFRREHFWTLAASKGRGAINPAG